MKAFLVGLLFLFSLIAAVVLGLMLFPFLLIVAFFLQILLVIGGIVFVIWFLGKFIIFIWRSVRK
ncbi:MAG: hypothetical protein NTZ92_02950 [Candidatus Omnitrophica bacterium]|nr:hypothetical protein [Candidatus Omnitrophota bacterium]